MLAKSKSKEVKKLTMTKSKTPGENIYVDLIGPFHLSLGGSKYWVQIVDNASRMGFSYFIKTKDQIALCVDDYIG